MPPHSLVFGSSLDELGELLSRATSFSCSIGGAMESVLLPLLTALPEAEAEAEPPLLFACENDHKAANPYPSPKPKPKPKPNPNPNSNSNPNPNDHKAVDDLAGKLAGRVDVVS